MSARPPPTRPHIGLNPSSRLGSYSISDWGEDDAWDSGSDEEASGSGWRPAHPGLASSTAPKPVPKPNQNSSSSTLASSYTHINAPSPSSYPPRPDQPPAKQGWTIISNAQEGRRDEGKHGETDQYPDTDSDLIVGDLDPEEPVGPVQSTQVVRSRQTQCKVREDVGDIVKDPLRLCHLKPAAGDLHDDGTELSEKALRERSIRLNRRQRFLDCATNEDVSMPQLRKLAWNGVPEDLRPVAWPLLLGYLPLSAHVRMSTLARKRSEYLSLVELAFARNKDGLDQQIWHQIEIDVPRTRPGVPLWMHASTQRSLERILYVWAIRHPASGYVQGINDLVTPFYQVFLSAYIDSDPEEFDPAKLPTEALNAVEADSFWCLSRILNGIQDNYIAGQPGIQRSVKRMAELVARIDPPLSAHLEAENVEFMQFAFRWMNCLLMREISVKNTVRMWDTYLAEGPDAFSQFHLYVCSAFLVQWSKKLKQMDFQGIIMFLQSLPTQDWTDHEIELLLSEAFVHYSTWHNAQSHFGK
ncbi:rab-GTPase-TBC domain-containing protein [Cytidiella melzeri]|nr:rab-GTPase-TBC domain-containing protein [Cytidiella melzeri]